MTNPARAGAPSPTEGYDELVWTAEMVARFWDYESRFAANYFAFHHGPEIARRLGRWLRPDADVLDYGCGPGYLMAPLLANGCRVAGLDTSEQSRAAVMARFDRTPGFLGVYAPSEPRVQGLRFG